MRINKNDGQIHIKKRIAYKKNVDNTLFDC